MFIRTQDRQVLVNLNNIINISAESGENYSKLYAFLTRPILGCNWVVLGEFQDKDKALYELDYIQNWINQSTNKVYEITID